MKSILKLLVFKESKASRRGLSLIETLIATLICVIAIAGALEAFHYTFLLARTARATSMALSDIGNMLERIACTPFNDITINFPDGVIDGGASDYPTIVGGYSLNNEQIRVDYTNPSSDPLEVIVTVGWLGPRNRPYTISLSTFKTE